MCNNISNNVCAVVVLFNPDAEIVKKLINSIMIMVDSIIIIDNKSETGIPELLEKNVLDEKVQLFHMANNLGLAAGQNVGIKWALEHEFDYILLLDQDSIPQENMVEILIDSTVKLESQGFAVASVGPQHFDVRTGFKPKFHTKWNDLSSVSARDNTNIEESMEITYLQSSGSLTSAKILREVGLMDEALFIHHIDQEWCLRAKSKGFSCFAIPQATCAHTIGDRVIRIWIGRWRDVHIHSPRRHYFASRNSFLLYKRSYMPSYWIIRDAAHLLFIFVFNSLFVSPRWEHTSMMIKGMKDGISDKCNIPTY